MSDATPRYEATFYLKSGATFTILTTDLEVGRSKFDGSLVSLSWKHPDGTDAHLRYISLEHIAAVTTKPDTVERKVLP